MNSTAFPVIVEPRRLADGGRAGTDAYAESIRQVGTNPPPPSSEPTSRGGTMSQTEFNARAPVDMDKVARQQAQLKAMLEARGKPVKKAKGGRIHPAIHHLIAHHLMRMSTDGPRDFDTTEDDAP